MAVNQTCPPALFIIRKMQKKMNAIDKINRNTKLEKFGLTVFLSQIIEMKVYHDVTRIRNVFYWICRQK